MTLQKISYADFYNNLEFFRQHLCDVYNLYDNPKYAHLERKVLEDKVLCGFEKFFEQHKNNCFLMMASEKNQICSMVAFEKRKKDVWYVDSMATRKQNQGQHLATIVLEEGMKNLSGEIFLHVDKTNTPAINLYQKLGFQKDNSGTIEKVDNTFILSKQLTKQKQGEMIIC